MSTLRKMMLVGGVVIFTASTPALTQQNQQMPMTDQMTGGGQPGMMGGPKGMMGHEPGMMGGQPGMMGGQQGMMGGQPGMMGGQQGMMRSGMCPMMGSGMQGMMGMGSGMMGGMGSGMMHGGVGDSGALFGSRVTPIMNLSAEDVRGYLGAQLDRLNNKRLKVGELKADDGTITADIVTVDNSLVQRVKVDRRTGAIEYQQ